MFLGELAGLATSVAWAASAILFTIGGRRIGSDVVNVSRLTFSVFFIVTLHYLLEGSLFPSGIETDRLAWFSLSSVLGLVLGDGLLFQAFVTLGPRLSQVIMSLVPIFSAFMAWVFFGELVTVRELAGILLTVGAVAWVVSERQGEAVVENKQYGRGILLAVGGALGQSTGLITSRIGLADGYPTISANLIRIIVAMLILWGITMMRGRVRHTMSQWKNRKALAATLGGTVTGPVLGIWLSLIAIQLTRVGIATTLSSLSPIILIPLSRVMYKEPITLRSVVGTLVAFSGVALILLK